MNQVLIYFKIAALAAVTFLCITMSMLVIKAKATLTNLDMVIASTSSITANINKTLDEINRPCGGHASCGTIADFNRTLATLRGTLGIVEIAAKHENAQLYALDAQERILYSDLHATLLAGQTTLGRSADLLATLNQTGKDTQPVIAEAHTSLAKLTESLENMNKLIADPAIPATIHSAQTIAANTASATGHLDAASKDAQTWLHGVLHPTWPTRIYHVGLDFLKAYL
jgi:glutamate mutase epsilon subunit